MDIDKVPDKEFTRVSSLVEEISREERHFNELNSKYKLLASTWLLSTFAGTGYILVNNIEPVFLYISIICLAGSIGIYLLWIIDIRVYQQLLAANFVEGLKLEKKHKWLPPVRQNMVNSQATGNVVSNLVWFYILSIIGLSILGVLAISIYLYSLSFVVNFIVTSIIILLYFELVKRMIGQSTEEVLSNSKEYNVVRSMTVSGVISLLISLLLTTSISFVLEANRIKKDKMETVALKKDYDYLAPDGSEIRLLANCSAGNHAHCVLPPGSVTDAVEHKTVVELWYVLSGNGKLWRKTYEGESTIELLPGTSISIPTGTKFQFRNDGTDSLKIIITTMPPWPGSDEAIKVEGIWK